MFDMRIETLPRAVAGAVFMAFVLAAPPAPLAFAAGSGELQSARRSLSAAHDALAAASAELEALIIAGALTQTDVADYREYIGRLKRSVVANCRVILALKRQMGEPGAEPGCDADGLRPAGPVAFPDEQTEGERIARLDSALGASLSEFDELLLREMDELARRRSGSPDKPGGSGVGTGEEGQGEGTQASQGGAEGGVSGAGSAEGGAQGGAAQQQGAEEVASQPRQGDRQSGVPGEGRPGGRDASQTASRDAPPAEGDDDIVAMQLREAAENEADPELREKLWEEYRRYKQKQTAQTKNQN
jgi:hypothetical protein